MFQGGDNVGDDFHGTVTGLLLIYKRQGVVSMMLMFHTPLE